MVFKSEQTKLSTLGSQDVPRLDAPPDLEGLEETKDSNCLKIFQDRKFARMTNDRAHIKALRPMPLVKSIRVLAVWFD